MRARANGFKENYLSLRNVVNGQRAVRRHRGEVECHKNYGPNISFMKHM